MGFQPSIVIKQKAILIALLFSPALIGAAPTPVGPFNFGGGLNLQKNPTDIRDDQSPDMCNCISNLDGSSSKRYGGERFIEQAVSTQSFNSLYRYYASTGTTIRKGLIGVSGSRVVYSTSELNPSWIVLSSFVYPNQKWSFVTMNNKVIMTGDALVDNIKQFDIFTSSFTDLFQNDLSSEAVHIRAKYLVSKSNYLLAINCSDITLAGGTTYYPSRVYYSYLNKQSSFTYNRFFDIRTNDGQELTGGGAGFDAVHLAKESSWHELTFTNLNIPSQGGDQEVHELVNGFGVKAPKTLQNTGLYYIFGAQDSIRVWDGGRRSRLTVAEESRPISEDIQTLINKLIKAGTYERAVGKYYKKREWYILSYEDPEKFPRGRNNSVMVYDLKLAQWYPICGWLADSFETFDGISDKGELVYGDSMDGYVHYADLEIRTDDARKELSIDTMDSSGTWRGTNFGSDFTNIREGTGSLRLWINAGVTASSMTIMKVFPLGEWYDKSKSSREDKISFKIYTTSIGHISNLRVDLEVKDIGGNTFDSNFTSVTLTSATLNIGNTAWATIEVPLSTFSIRPDWTNLDSEVVPFANTPTFYGVRIVLNGVNVSSVSIDDFRFVQAKASPVNFYRFTKMFDFGKPELKEAGKLLLTMEKSPESVLYYDVYNDFGSKVNTEFIEAEIPREIMVCGFVSSASIAIIDDSDFSIKSSTIFVEADFLPLNGVANKDFIFFPDRTNNRLVKMDRSPFGVILSTYGALGSGTTNFNTAHQHEIDDKGNIYLVDMSNQRIKIHSQKDLSFIKMTGSLGMTATSYHQPTGISVDENRVIVADEGNYRWTEQSISTLGIVQNKELDYNTIGDTSLDQDENFVYGAYNKTPQDSVESQDVILEKRFKGSLDLVNRVRITPKNIVAISTYGIMGDIALRGRYIFISFSDNSLGLNSTYYLQKRLKSDFSLVSEYKSTREFYSVIGDPYAHKPMTKNKKFNIGTSGKYLQLRYYDSGLDNNVRLINQTYVVEAKELTY